MKFEVQFTRTRTEWCRVEVTAEDEEQAQEKAEAQLDKDQFRVVKTIEWELEDENLDCDSVEVIEEDDK